MGKVSHNPFKGKPSKNGSNSKIGKPSAGNKAVMGNNTKSK